MPIFSFAIWALLILMVNSYIGNMPGTQVVEDVKITFFLFFFPSSSDIPFWGERGKKYQVIIFPFFFLFLLLLFLLLFPPFFLRSISSWPQVVPYWFSGVSILSRHRPKGNRKRNKTQDQKQKERERERERENTTCLLTLNLKIRHSCKQLNSSLKTWTGKQLEATQSNWSQQLV